MFSSIVYSINKSLKTNGTTCTSCTSCGISNKTNKNQIKQDMLEYYKKATN